MNPDSRPRPAQPPPDPAWEAAPFTRDITTALVVINLAVFVIEPHGATMFRRLFELRYSLSLDGLKAHYWWQFLTYQFLHAGWIHLGANLLLLHSLGPVLETTLGRRRFLALYLVSGVVGGLAQMGGALVSPRHFGHPVVGASAGLCGLVSALGTLYAEQRVQGLLLFLIPFRVKAKILLLIAGLLTIAGTLFPVGNVAHLAHLGGFLGGLLCVNFMPARPLELWESPPPDPGADPGAGPRNPG